uniref:F-box domain-containing protein n=1 Tax=Globodera rostochiensis TaxID=31243 RepID=A0A914HWL6_GLORO
MNYFFFSAMTVLANTNLFPFLFALVIGIPSAMLYCLELLIIVTNFSHFDSAFFVLVAVRAILLWRRGLSFCIVATLLLPLPFTVPIFDMDMFVHVQHDNVSFTLDDHKTTNELNSTAIAAWSAVVFAIVCLLLNLDTIFAYKINKFQKQNGQSSTTECKMTIYTVATFFGQLIMAIFMVFLNLTASTFVDEQNNRYSLAQKWFGITLAENDILFLANFNQYPWVNDFAMVAIPAWLLLWASTKMRKIIFSKFNPMGQSEQNVVTMHIEPLQQQIYRKFPNECWVACLKFLDRDNLQTMQLVSSRFDQIVEKHFGHFPLRRVDRCKVSSSRSNAMKVRLICLGRGRTIETDSDLQLWLRHGFVECIEFIEFKFTYEILRELQEMKQGIFMLNYCVFAYEKRASPEPFTWDQIAFLFSIETFRKCHGAVFSFLRRCAFRPTISELLKLPPKSMIIDFDGCRANPSDNKVISDWLNGICDDEFDHPKETKALFLKGFDYFHAIPGLIETLKEDFVKATTKQSFILNIECDDDMNFEQKLENWTTGEKFKVNTVEGVMCARRE